MWESMEGFEKVLWLIAVPATVVFLIQTVLTLVGVSGDHTDTAVHHHDGDTSGHFPLFTIRNLIVFLMMSGWTGIAMIRQFNAGIALTLVVALFVGLAMMFLVALMFYGISKLSSSGNFKIDTSLVGMQASVYLKIPAEMSGAGKIQVTAQGQKRELRAQTRGKELPTGATVKIAEVTPDTIIVA